MKTDRAITFDEIYRHALDQEIGSRPIDPLIIACTRSRLEDKMLALIKRRGLLDSLLVDLGLCTLCQDRQYIRKAAK